MTGLPYLFARVERGAADGLDTGEADELRALRARYLRIFDVRERQAEVLLFRLAQCGAPTARSLRRVSVID